MIAFQIISLCPLILLNKATFKNISAGKLIGDILIPAFLTKDEEVQKEISKTVPVLACLSMSSYRVVITTVKDVGHTVFSNGPLHISVVCSKCHNVSESVHIQKPSIEIFSESDSATTSKMQTVIGLRHLFCKFLNEKQYKAIENTEYWKLFERLSNHYYAFNYGLSTEIVREENCSQILKALEAYIDNSRVSTYIFGLYTFLFKCYFAGNSNQEWFSKFVFFRWKSMQNGVVTKRQPLICA